ncbi:MAG: methionine--tRNA ligase, partial [Treponema sp.]|nr:methionine--tRNA ligase [Treponema sp.]
PWRMRTEDPPKAAATIRDLAFVVRDLAILVEPFLPDTSRRVAGFFGEDADRFLRWENLGRPSGLSGTATIESGVLFAKLEDTQMDEFRERFSGKLEDRAEPAKQSEPKAETNVSGESAVAEEAVFEKTLDLRVARIKTVERHPNADKLYVLGLELGPQEDGTVEERTIVSGLVAFYAEQELLGKRIIVAYNLKPAKLRGILSRGMLLAAGDKGGKAEDGTPAERCEVLDAGDAEPGTRLLPEGAGPEAVPAEIDIDRFFGFPITVSGFAVQSGGRNLCLGGRPVRTGIIGEGKVN